MANDEFEIDPNLYTRSPIIDVAGGIALSIGLLTTYKAHADARPETIARAAKRLRKTTLTLQSGWDGQRDAGLILAEDKRPADQLSDRSWAALSKRLEGLMLLPATFEEARRATQLHARFFPTGLAFTQLPYPRQWAECQQRIRDLKKEGVEDELRELCGDVVVDALKAAHDNYGRALGITTAKDAAPKAPKIVDQLRALQKAVSDYAIQLVAVAKDDPELGTTVLACLSPIDELRAADASRATGTPASTTTPSTPPVTPATPIPSLSDES